MNVHSSSRERILEASLALFVRQGFHGTPVPRIAREAGVAAGTIYRTFPSKDALVNVLYREAKTNLLASLLNGLDVGAEPRQVFRQIWFRLAKHARAFPLELAFLELHHHASYLDEESKALEEHAFEPFYAYFETERAREAFRSLPAPALMAIVLGAFFGLFKASLFGHLEWDEVVVAEAEVAVWDAVSRPRKEA
ncbi:MAG: TetR/AcrR family transcriptional regulator [Myxococcota bacterium]